MSSAPENIAPTGQLGTIVSWQVPKEVSFETLKNALKTAGLSEDLALVLAPRNALTRALGEMRKGRVIRKLRRDGDKLLFQFTREYLDEREIKYDREAELSLDLTNAHIDCDVQEIADEARTLTSAHIGKRLTSDLTRLLQRIYASYSADLIPIREQGGAYFVPDIHRDLVEHTRVLLDEIDGDLRSFDVRLGSDDTSASVASSMSEYLSSLITEFRESCAEVDGGSRKDVIERRRGTVLELRQKLELYKGLLSGYAETIAEEVKTAEAELLAKLAHGAKEPAGSE